MGQIRGWAWTWLVLALCFSAWGSVGGLAGIPIRPALFVAFPIVAMMLGVLVAQQRFSPVRALAAMLVAVVARLMFSRGFDAVLGYGSAQLLLALTAMGVIVTIIAAVSLRKSSTFVAAAVTAVAALVLPLVDTFARFWNFDVVRAFVILGLSGRGFFIAASVAMSFVAVWLGTRASDLMPSRRASHGAEADLPPNGA